MVCARTIPSLRRACIEGLAAARDTHSTPALREIFPRETDPASRAAFSARSAR